MTVHTYTRSEGTFPRLKETRPVFYGSLKRFRLRAMELQIGVQHASRMQNGVDARLRLIRITPSCLRVKSPPQPVSVDQEAAHIFC